MECRNCKRPCIKYGRQSNGKQRYLCRHCHKCQQQEYRYNANNVCLGSMVPKLICNSVGIRSMSRVLEIAVNAAAIYIKKIASSITKPPIPLNRACFEMDELRAYIQKKENQYWVAYTLCSETREVLDFIVGKRSKRVLRMVVNTALQSGVGNIKTDRLNIY